MESSWRKVLRTVVISWLLWSVVMATKATKVKKTTAGPLNKGTDLESKKLPNALLIGVGKCGTTALIEMLGLHPDIAARGNPETSFFLLDKKYSKGLEYYRSLMPDGSVAKRIVIEKSPRYFDARPVIPVRVHHFNSSVRLILLVRDPVERTLSEYVHQTDRSDANLVRFHRNEFPTSRPVPSLEDLFGCDRGDGVDWDACQDAGDKGTNKQLAVARDSLLRASYYARHLKQWLALFPLDQILVVNGDMMAEEPAVVVREVCEHLGLDPTLFPDSALYFNSTKGHYCWKQQQHEKKGWQRARGTCLGKSKGRPRPSISPQIVHKLRAHFRPHNKQFFALIGKRFPKWQS